jgi:hypothetical protein
MTAFWIFCAQKLFCVALKLLEDESGDLLGRELLHLAPHLHPEAPIRAHTAFYGKNGPGGVKDGLALGQLPHKDLPVFREGHGRGG